MRKSVSVIIIAHKNARPLLRATNAINQYTRSSDQKIIVLNNPSPEVMKFAATLKEDWLILYETKPGPQHARNTGASDAQHEYLFFLDDDTELSAGAIDSLITKFTNPYIALVQAYISLEKGHHFFWNYLRAQQLGMFKKFLRKELQYCDSAAILVKKDWFKAVKGFSPDLQSGEDKYFAIKLTTHKAQIVYDFKTPLTQIYDPSESLWNFIKKIKASTPYTILLKKKLGVQNEVKFPRLDIKHMNFRNASYKFLDFFLKLYLEVLLTPYRNELAPLQEKIKLK